MNHTIYSELTMALEELNKQLAELNKEQAELAKKDSRKANFLKRTCMTNIIDLNPEDFRDGDKEIIFQQLLQTLRSNDNEYFESLETEFKKEQKSLAEDTTRAKDTKSQSKLNTLNIVLRIFSDIKNEMDQAKKKDLDNTGGESQESSKPKAPLRRKRSKSLPLPRLLESSHSASDPLKQIKGKTASNNLRRRLLTPSSTTVSSLPGVTFKGITIELEDSSFEKSLYTSYRDQYEEQEQFGFYNDEKEIIWEGSKNTKGFTSIAEDAAEELDGIKTQINFTNDTINIKPYKDSELKLQKEQVSRSVEAFRSCGVEQSKLITKIELSDDIDISHLTPKQIQDIKDTIKVLSEGDFKIDSGQIKFLLNGEDVTSKINSKVKIRPTEEPTTVTREDKNVESPSVTEEGRSLGMRR